MRDASTFSIFCRTNTLKETCGVWFWIWLSQAVPLPGEGFSSGSRACALFVADIYFLAWKAEGSRVQATFDQVVWFCFSFFSLTNFEPKTVAMLLDSFIFPYPEGQGNLFLTFWLHSTSKFHLAMLQHGSRSLCGCTIIPWCHVAPSGIPRASFICWEHIYAKLPSICPHWFSMLQLHRFQPWWKC